MMIPDLVKVKSSPKGEGLILEHIVNHIDHVCQLAGNSLHAGIGTDLDGEFSNEQNPSDIDTIADIQLLATLLSSRGYTEEDIRNITSDNFIRFLRNSCQ
jgi:membrane dipeptidase